VLGKYRESEGRVGMWIGKRGTVREDSWKVDPGLRVVRGGARGKK